MVEYFGGQLGILSYPMHGKPSMITLTTAGKAERRYVSLEHFEVITLGWSFGYHLLTWEVFTRIL